jgi:hypothetical protein
MWLCPLQIMALLGTTPNDPGLFLQYMKELELVNPNIVTLPVPSSF